MPNTLIPIQTYTLSSAASSVTFSNIPQNYTDLKLVMSARSSVAQTYDGTTLSFNGTSASTNWNRKQLEGGDGAANSYNSTTSVAGYISAANATANTFGSVEIYIPNYTSSVNKSVSIDSVTESNAANGVYQDLIAQLWSNTAAITSITIATNNGNLLTGSTFTLYGVSNGVKATGGTLTVAGGYAYHTFTSTGSFLPNQQIKNAECLVIAGGGGGGRTNDGGYGCGAGGGAGGYKALSGVSFFAGSSYTAVIGAGGNGGGTSSNGTAGSNSLFLNLTATGGNQGAATGGVYQGGTAGADNSYAGGSGGATSSGSTESYAGGGGGGASAAGSAGVAGTAGGAGGTGLLSYGVWADVTGTGVNRGYAGGGGGGAGRQSSGATFVAGYATSGGGSGGAQARDGSAGTANTGGGGGGGGSNAGTYYTSGAGGSGLIIVRYPLS